MNSSKVLEEIFTLGSKLRIQGVPMPKWGGKAFQSNRTTCKGAQIYGVFRKLLFI